MRQPLRDEFSSEEWDKIALEILAFNHSLLYQAFRRRLQDRVAQAYGKIENEMQTNNIYQQQGRVIAHKRDIMIFEDLLETAKQPAVKRTPRHGRART